MARKYPAITCGVLLTLAAAASSVGQTPMGTAFTYQGRLTDAGLPATGSYDLAFRLFDVPSGGSPLATTTLLGVPVAQGLFTVPLDFGAPVFAGQARWLEIQVQPPAGPILGPRQPLTPSPYALFSSFTDPAHLTTLNAGNLTAGTVPSSVLSGTYSNPLTLSNAGNAFFGDGSGLTNLNANALYARTVVVSPEGTPAQNGSALLAALAGIVTASAASPFLLKIEPGVYDIGSASLVMKPYVDIEGSGETVTKITGTGSALNTVGTVQAVSNSELRLLTVENTGGAAYAKPLYVSGATPRISHVTILGSGAALESQGLFVDNNGAPAVTDLTVNVTATGTANSYGVLFIGPASGQIFNVRTTTTGGSFSQATWVYGGANPTLRNLFAVATGATTQNRGMTIWDSSPVLENVVGLGTGAAADTNIGILNIGTSAPTMRVVTCRGSGATNINYGCANENDTHPTMIDVVGEATGGQTAIGIRNVFAATGLSLTRVSALASGASAVNTGLNVDNCSPTIAHLEATAAGAGGDVRGVDIVNAAPTASHLTVVATGTGAATAVGIRTTGASSPQLRAVSASGIGGANAYGARNEASTRAVFDGGVVSGLGGSATATGIANDSGTITVLANLTANASGSPASSAIVNTGITSLALTNVRAVGSGTGLLNQGASGTVSVDRSTLSGASFSVQNGAGLSTRIAVSQLAGTVSSAGTISCFTSYNGSYAGLNALCQ